MNDMEKVFRFHFVMYGPEKVVEFAVSKCSVRDIRTLAESIQELPVECKVKLAEEVMRRGEWHDVYYFLQCVRNLPEVLKDRLLDKVGIIDPEKRKILRNPVV